MRKCLSEGVPHVEVSPLRSIYVREGRWKVVVGDERSVDGGVELSLRDKAAILADGGVEV